MLRLGIMSGAALVGAPPCSPRPRRAQEPPRPAVVVAPAEVADLRVGVNYTGRVVAAQKVDLRARVSGFLEEIHFTEGGTVAAGDVLFTIQDDAYRAAVREAEGAMRAAEAERDLAELERDRKATLVARAGGGAERARRRRRRSSTRTEGQLSSSTPPSTAQKLELSYTQVVAPFDGHRRPDRLRRRGAGRPRHRAACHADPARPDRGRASRSRPPAC